MESEKVIARLDETRVNRISEEEVGERGLPKGEWWASQGKTPWGDVPHKLKKKKGGKGKKKR